MKRTAAFIVLLIFAACQSENNQTKEKDPVKNSSDKRDSVPVIPVSVNPYTAPDVSPMDMIYFPVDYPKLKMTNAADNGPSVRIIYSRPQKLGRKIFGELLKYGQPWRLGANEATEVQFFKSATIQNKKIEPGRYILYCIPREKKWTIVLNSNIDTWGLQPDARKDIFRFDIPVEHNPVPVEFFTMTFEKNRNEARLVISWDDVLARLPIAF